MNNTLSALRRTPYQTLGVIFAMFFSFLILLIFSFSILLLTKLVSYIETQPQVTVYFLKTTAKSDIYKLREDLLNTGLVKEAQYVSQEDALKIYKELNKNEPLLLEMVSKDALPSSLEVFTTKPEYLKDIAEEARTNPGVEEVAYQQDIIDSLITITNSVKRIALIFLVAQFMIVFFVVFTTITFKIIAKKDEIEIMRLLGATRFFIVKPLLKQNLALNFVAALLSALVFVGGYLYSFGYLNSFLTGIPTLSILTTPWFNLDIWPLNFYMFAGLAGLTLVIGYTLIWFTTLLAAGKYIK
jgi:cell division transport system permease protein